MEWIYTDTHVDFEALSELYTIAPLGDKKVDDLKVVFSNSMYKCFVYDNSKLIGVGRALADGMDTSYLCDVAVHPEYQGKGLGKQIIEKLVKFSNGHSKIILYAVPGKEAFYMHCGFAKMSTAIAIFKNEAQAIEWGLVTK